jgi:hypothetical protein
VIAKMVKKVQIVDCSAKPDVDALVNELSRIHKQKAILEKRDKEIKLIITDHYFNSAQKDNRGNSFYETTFLDGTPAILKREARTTIKLDYQKAMEFFSNKNLLKEVAEQKWVFSDESIEQALAGEKITYDELESICEKKVTYAIKFVKATEDEDATEY